MEGGLYYSNHTVSSPEEKEKLSVWDWAGGRATAADVSDCWPPRSYACTFCRREFKSAQALGGHMNVHRRDRALLRLQRPEAPTYSIVIPQQPPSEFPAGGGVFLVYPISAGAVVAPALASPPSYLSSPVNAGVGMGSSESITLCDISGSEGGGEELDLELRLGR
ncbi:zinc finger protein 10-like [Zingiber officinale]|uniref:C2H2-type domain-containing protein n=1 Tax=Zingiber officinale TaxID=94328 RepID=A0A8J5GY99_ZINOF|nr:zinc finger protein 10-like [Zingiber officinale]KAG6507729.1 hypothetical protein ZIOFF_033080 [Zingiber officinale]